MTDLDARIEAIAQSAVLLVGTDFDGTLAPVVADPCTSVPLPGAVEALHALAELPRTHVAIISGRARADLAGLAGTDSSILLVGSHGIEFDSNLAGRLTADETALHLRILDDLKAIAAGNPAFLLEIKPASVAFHYRQADPRDAIAAVGALLAGPAVRSGVHLKLGDHILELGVLRSDKGDALKVLRTRFGASAVLFIGDDITDEDAFATLTGQDWGIKVGSGDTRAASRLPSCDDVPRFLTTLLDLRRRWLAGAGAVPIELHALLSDQRTLALITPDARVVWACAPRADATSLFAELLGGPMAGYFAIGAADGSPPRRQSYLGDTFLLQTDWGGFSVTDYFDCTAGRPFQRASRSDLIRVLEGRGRVLIEFRPRLDFGREPTRLSVRSEGLQVEGSLEPIVLRAPGVDWTITEDGRHHAARAVVDLSGAPLALELRYGLSSSQESAIAESQRREQSARFWTSWADTLRLPRVRPDLVKRSALVLKALCYGPTGAFFAAATTSLPEELGGTRNWDYRFAWLRDSAIAAVALAGLAAIGPGLRLLDWVLGILDRNASPESLRPVYTVTGGHLAPEAEIWDLPGYGGSRPVRVGNAAAQQLQLDVYGAILDLVVVLAERGASLTTEHWRLTESLVHAVGLRWQEPDHGIWEVRNMRRHFVHSKVMCWAAVDRALRIAQVFSEQMPPQWIDLRRRIAEDVVNRGWSDTLGAFASSYEETSLDAATLWIGLAGLLPPEDAKFVSTVAAIHRSLRLGPAVYRYRYDDGLPGVEGGFHLCTAWLIQSLALIGRLDDACELFESFTQTFGPTGLGSEEYCPRTHRSLGNHPQLYTHAGLIQAALQLSAAGVSIPANP